MVEFRGVIGVFGGTPMHIVPDHLLIIFTENLKNSEVNFILGTVG